MSESYHNSDHLDCDWSSLAGIQKSLAQASRIVESPSPEVAVAFGNGLREMDLYDEYGNKRYNNHSMGRGKILRDDVGFLDMYINADLRYANRNVSDPSLDDIRSAASRLRDAQIESHPDEPSFNIHFGANVSSTPGNFNPKQFEDAEPELSPVKKASSNTPRRSLEFEDPQADSYFPLDAGLYSSDASEPLEIVQSAIDAVHFSLDESGFSKGDSCADTTTPSPCSTPLPDHPSLIDVEAVEDMSSSLKTDTGPNMNGNFGVPEPSCRPDKNTLMDYLLSFKSRFSQNQGVFLEFLDIVNEWTHNEIDYNSMKEQLSVLLSKTYPDLLEGFLNVTKDIELPAAASPQSVPVKNGSRPHIPRKCRNFAILNLLKKEQQKKEESDENVIDGKTQSQDPEHYNNGEVKECTHETRVRLESYEPFDAPRVQTHATLNVNEDRFAEKEPGFVKVDVSMFSVVPEMDINEVFTPKREDLMLSIEDYVIDPDESDLFQESQLNEPGEDLGVLRCDDKPEGLLAREDLLQNVETDVTAPPDKFGNEKIIEDASVLEEFFKDLLPSKQTSQADDHRFPLDKGPNLLADEKCIPVPEELEVKQPDNEICCQFGGGQNSLADAKPTQNPVSNESEAKLSNGQNIIVDEEVIQNPVSEALEANRANDQVCVQLGDGQNVLADSKVPQNSVLNGLVLNQDDQQICIQLEQGRNVLADGKVIQNSVHNELIVNQDDYQICIKIDDGQNLLTDGKVIQNSVPEERELLGNEPILLADVKPIEIPVSNELEANLDDDQISVQIGNEQYLLTDGKVIQNSIPEELELLGNEQNLLTGTDMKPIEIPVPYELEANLDDDQTCVQIGNGQNLLNDGKVIQNSVLNELIVNQDDDQNRFLFGNEQNLLTGTDVKHIENPASNELEEQVTLTDDRMCLHKNSIIPVDVCLGNSSVTTVTDGEGTLDLQQSAVHAVVESSRPDVPGEAQPPQMVEEYAGVLATSTIATAMELLGSTESLILLPPGDFISYRDSEKISSGSTDDGSERESLPDYAKPAADDETKKLDTVDIVRAMSKISINADTARQPENAQCNKPNLPECQKS